jgi:hypothetical protein
VFCDSCGYENREAAEFCANCGMMLEPLASQTASASSGAVPGRKPATHLTSLYLPERPAQIVKPHRPRWPVAMVAVLMLVMVGTMALLLLEHKGETVEKVPASQPGASTEQAGTSTTEPTSEVPPAQISTAPVRPEFSGIILHPYDLLKDPFTHKGELVQLDTLSIPEVANGNLVQIQRFPKRIVRY